MSEVYQSIELSANKRKIRQQVDKAGAVKELIPPTPCHSQFLYLKWISDRLSILTGVIFPGTHRAYGKWRAVFCGPGGHGRGSI